MVDTAAPASAFLEPCSNGAVTVSGDTPEAVDAAVQQVRAAIGR